VTSEALRLAQMPHAAVLGMVVIVLGLVGCGDESGVRTSRPTATASATATSRDDYYVAMDDLVTRLDRAVAAAIAGEANAVARIKGVVRDVRHQLRQRRAAGDDVSAAGNLVLTTALSARDYARHREREGLQLIRDVPVIEARDALTSESQGG
jgi:hypothetical protein